MTVESVDIDNLFEDENNLKDEMSDEKVREHVEKIKEKRQNASANYGRDGSLAVYSEKFKYRGMPFRIVVKRYFRIYPMDIDAEMSQGMNKWARLEAVDKSGEAAAFLDKYDIKLGFFNHHTTHSWNEGMSLRKRFEECVEKAEDDIDWFRDKAEDQVEEKISEMESWFEQVKDDEN